MSYIRPLGVHQGGGERERAGGTRVAVLMGYSGDQNCSESSSHSL